MYLWGKSLYKKHVALAVRHSRTYIIFSFKTSEEAVQYYDSFDFENKKMIKDRVKIFFCKHANEYKLDVGSDLYHYIHCPDCKRATYVDDESQEDREKRIDQAMIRYKEHEIKDMEGLIESKRKELDVMKDELELLRKDEIQ